MNMQKDQTIIDFLAQLHLEKRNWIVVDHWELDTCAVGIAKTSDPRRLVYISTYDKKTGRYYYECEAPAGQNPDEYVVTCKSDEVDITQLLEVVENHLSD